jgi:hypothetical protein
MKRRPGAHLIGRWENIQALHLYQSSGIFLL